MGNALFVERKGNHEAWASDLGERGLVGSARDWKR
jgi:hypothetical protein